jgi:hypothetical protein
MVALLKVNTTIIFVACILCTTCKGDSASLQENICEPGFGIEPRTRKGRCRHQIATKEECFANLPDATKKGTTGWHITPPGCYIKGKTIWFSTGSGHCSDTRVCVCSKQCHKCPKNYYSAGGNNAECMKCPGGTSTTTEGATSQSECTCAPGTGWTTETTQNSCNNNEIMTQEECKHAAESSNTNFLVGNAYSPHFPRGCSQSIHSKDQYYWNPIESPTQNQNCGAHMASSCICKKSTCSKCPTNTYGEGGANKFCKSCPHDAPFTVTNIPHDSIKVCATVEDALYCAAGKEYRFDPTPVRESGHCKVEIQTKEECFSEVKIGYGGIPKILDRREDSPANPATSHGCLYRPFDKTLYWNPFHKNTENNPSCVSQYKCVCSPKMCTTCPINTYSTGGAGSRAKCHPCISPLVTDADRTKCYDPHLQNALDDQKKVMKKIQDDAKSMVSDLKAKAHTINTLTANQENINERVGTNEMQSVVKSKLAETKVIQSNHDLRKKREADDKKSQQQFCVDEQNAIHDTNMKNRIQVFPVVPFKKEDIDKTSCLLMNRDRIITAFCQFRQDFKTTLIDHQIETNPKIYWPNICCATSGDDCNKDNEVPFALAKGGNATKESLYSEIQDLLGKHGEKENGFLYKGMLKALEAIKESNSQIQTDNIESRLSAMFQNMHLCGPRIFDSPKEDGTKVCQLFYSYRHMMTSFHKQVKLLYAKSDAQKITKKEQTMRRRRILSRLRIDGPLDRSKYDAIQFLRLTNAHTLKSIQKVNDEMAKGLGLKNHGKLYYLSKDIYKTIQGSRGEKGERGERGEPGKDATGVSDLTAKVDLLANKVLKDNSTWKFEKAKVDVPNVDVSATKNLNEQFEENKRKTDNEIRILKSQIGERGELGKDATGASNAQFEEYKRKTDNEIRILKSQIAMNKRANKAMSTSNKVNCLKPLKMNSAEELDETKKHHCREYGVDLHDDDIMNVAVVYIGKDIGRDEEFKNALKNTVKFNVKDYGMTSIGSDEKNCAPEMFDAKDISLQEIENNGIFPSGKSDWALVINLDFKSKAGFLQSQFMHCNRHTFIPRAEMHVEIYDDLHSCCTNSKDANECQDCSLEMLDHHYTEKPLAFKLKVTGNVFQWELDDFVLKGTKFVSKTRKNNLKIGEDVNGGGVKTATSLIELAVEPIEPIDKLEAVELEKLKKLDTTCMNIGKAKELFKDVTLSSDGKVIGFSCQKSKQLCECLTKTGLGASEVVFRADDGSTLKLIGDGQYVSYNVELPTRRRRLLGSASMTQRGGRGGC